ncbi:MAG TPA: trehalose-phosphatase [Vicinamibacterales bacterium]|nr:trehalose-phosphatase [Vicinamibacterales bacterium]
MKRQAGAGDRHPDRRSSAGRRGAGGVRVPSALDQIEAIDRELDGRRPAVFLDYDGTLTEIVSRPERAVLSEAMRSTVEALAGRCPVAVISGRDRRDVASLVRLPSLVYAGSHGFDIAGPGATEIQYEVGGGFAAVIEQAARDLRRRLGGLEGVIVEPKRYAVAVHYRLVAPADLPAVRGAVSAVLARWPALIETKGKKVFELRPRVDWDKGRAVVWLLQALGLDRPDILPIYLGDDATDEDAFGALEGRGIGIRVAARAGATRATYRLRNVDEVRRFLDALAARLEAR